MQNRKYFPSVILFGLLLSIILCKKFNLYVDAQTTSVSFGMAGDFANGTQFHNTINSMKNSALDFVVAAGDFSYSSSSATSWSNYIVSTLGSNFPFQLIAGNHDAGYLSSFTSILTNKISSASTDSLSKYGQQYYFDYPVTNPLIRVIMLGPDDSPLSYTYPAGSANYNWVANAIDSGRSKNIPWIAVAMHKNCITSGTKSCEIGTDVLNLFISKKVDLILQGHDHNYQRSFPLRNAASDPVNASGCAKVTTSFNANCINANATNTYRKSAGSTLVIAGTGGQNLYSNSLASQNGFFASKSFTSYGFSKFVVTPDQITMNFVNNSSGGFTDSITILNDSANYPTNTPAVSTPVPTSGSKLPGDANGDNLVNGIDFAIWKSEFINKTGLNSDFNNNGTVEGQDFAIWKTAYLKV